VVAEPGIPARLDLLASTGVRVTRVDVLWNTVAPSRPASAANPGDPAYRWSRYDAIVDGLTERGIAVIFNVYRSPSWTNGGRGYQWAPSPGRFASFMTALARRYDGVTEDTAGRTHGPVEMFEPWNEPNLAGFLMPQWQTNQDGTVTPASPRIYSGLLARAYASVKAVQPDAWVIGVSGGPNGSDRPPSGSVGIVTFVQALVALRPPADAFAQHLYPALGPSASTAMPSYNRLPELIGELDAVRPGLPILITEFGWTTTATATRASHVSEQEQETYLREALTMLAAIPRVRLAVWFNLEDNAQWTSGLRRADTTPKPSWSTFSALAKPRAPGAVDEPPPPPAPEPPAVLAAPPPATPPAVTPPGLVPPPPIALTLSLDAPRTVRRARPLRVIVRLSRACSAPVLLQRRSGGRFTTIARARSSRTTVVISTRLHVLGRQRLRVRCRNRSALVRVLVVSPATAP
jgi:hypothetical protein